MALPILALLTMAALAAGYFLYGRFLAGRYGLDPRRKTPAVERADGVDFVPTKPFYLLGQHFSAIAAAGPIVGPIAACLQFGWLPCLLWIVVGAVFIGATHDFSALVASVRHGARSVAEIMRRNLSRRAWWAMLGFIWIALVYVIIAFTDVTAGTFLGAIEELEGVQVGFQQGGAVAFASIAYLSLAIVMGLVQKRWSPPLWFLTVVFVPATLAVVWLGTECSTWFVLAGPKAQKLWGAAILGYCFVASLLPVWLLLQPRGYLGGFVLYMVLAVSVFGILVGGFEIRQEAFKGADVTGQHGMTGLLFPFLFVTIACGACSGFHGLVASGTTSKQIADEAHCRPVGYGAMLLEGFVAVVALVTVMIAVPQAGKSAGAIYGEGIGRFLTVLIGPEHLLFAIVFGTMAFSTFVFDTLDVATRLGRYILQELFGWTGRAGAAAGTLLTVGTPLVFLLSAPDPGPGVQPAWKAFWVLFGTSNQLLAALTLIGIAVWLKRAGKPCWFVVGPMAFVLAVTVWALLLQAHGGILSPRTAEGTFNTAKFMNGIVSLVLLALAGLVAVEAVRAVRNPSAREESDSTR